MSIFINPELSKNISVLFRNFAISVSCLALLGCSVPKIDVNRIVKATPIAIPSTTPKPISAESPTVTPTSEKSCKLGSLKMTLGAILEDLLKRETLPVQEYENGKLVPIELKGYCFAKDLKSAVSTFLVLKKEKEIDIRVVSYAFNHRPDSVVGGLYGIDDSGELIYLGDGGLGYEKNSLSEIDFSKYLKGKKGIMLIIKELKYLIVFGNDYTEDIRDKVLIVGHTDPEEWFAYAQFLFVIPNINE